jgi:hypothetical protein
MPHNNVRLIEDYSRFCVTALVGGVICIPFVGVGPIVAITASIVLSTVLLQKLESWLVISSCKA